MKTYGDYTPQEIENIINDPEKMAQLQRNFDKGMEELRLYESVCQGTVIK